MKRVDINVDIGEGFPNDARLLDFATSANVCCGAHAGSWELTLTTIELCRSKGVRIGMHPGYPDRGSMGRRVPEGVVRLAPSLLGQASEFAKACPEVAYVKPHGAWYNQIVGGETVGRFDPAAPLVAIVKDLRIPAMILPIYRGLPKPWILREGFADRRYLADGRLAPRSEAGSVLTDPSEVEAQVLRLAASVDSICVHGDTTDAVEFAVIVRSTLERAGYEVWS